MEGLLPVLAAALGLAIGIALDSVYRTITIKREREATDSEKMQLTQRISALAAELAGARTEATQNRDLAARSAGWESLAGERERMIGVLNADREKIVANLVEERDRVISELRQKTAAEQHALIEASELKAQLQSQKKNLAEQLALLDKAKSTLSDEFQALAGEIVDKRSKAFADENKKDLNKLLTPLREQLTDFRKKVEEVQSDSSQSVNALQSLIGGLNNVNLQLAQETRNLSTALRGPSGAHGDWSELIVRNLLEKAGLREGEQFRIRQHSAGESNGDRRRSRPDVILNLPGSRHLVIDSKVSLSAWSDYADAITEEDRRQAMKRHLAALRAHVDALSGRGFHKLPDLGSPDFVVMFVPIEPAFLAALHEDDALWPYAWEKQILLVGPTTLLFVVRIADNLWQQEFQVRNVQEVMECGSTLYEKLVDFASDFDALGSDLRKLDQSYAGAIRKLREGPGNLVRHGETLRQLGVKGRKSIPRDVLDGAPVGRPLSIAADAGEAIPA